MARVHKSITINSPVEKVFAYIDDITTSPEWLPSMMEVSDITGSGVGQHYRWKYKMAGVPLNGESTVIEHIPNERRVIDSKGGVNAHWIYTFEPDDGGTKLDIEIEYTIPVPVLGKLAEKLVLKRNEREADMAMENVKEKMEAEG
ncbi:MAG: SRPBCC family protein [Myxococcales bacterium]|nr:MAG: SRPBCC family protein [Myxococcales bacterium]